MTKFRTHAEMGKLLSKLPDELYPYCITLHKTDRYFGFLGTSHSPDLGHNQWKRYFAEWELFLDSKNKNKIVLFEGGYVIIKEKNIADVIKSRADAGLTVWLAQKNKIPYFSPEPERSEEITHLKSKGFTEDELITYYIGRQITHWYRQDNQHYPNLDKYISLTLNYLKSYKWHKALSAKDARRLVESYIGNTKLEDATYNQLNSINHPAQNPVASECSHFRDEHIFSHIKKFWAEGKDIFCVYGSGHAIVLEPVLLKLVNAKNWGEL